MTYEEQLQDPRWFALRDKVLIRDDHECRYCMSSQQLQVHHMRYEAGKMAWEYPMDVLLTLCKRCHEGQHRLGFAAGSSLRQTKSIRQVMYEFVRQLGGKI